MEIRRRWWWVGGALLAALAIVVGAPLLLARLGDRAGGRLGAGSEELATVPIQPAAAVIGGVSASGNVALSRVHYVTLGVEGEIAQVLVKPGDRVQAGDLLLALDTVTLERTMRRAELNVQTQLNRRQQLEKDAGALELAAAQANLASALENLAQVRAGPTNAELAAARSNLSAATARYQDLLAGPNQTELVLLAAELRRREVALAQAQTNYNAVAWRNDVGMTPQAAELQQATIDYDTALANYEQSVTGASQADIQSALSAMQSAQSQLDDLLRRPTEGDIAAAEAQVAQAQSNLDNLLAGASETELRDAQIGLEQALIDLQEAYANLSKAQVTAPIDGAILTVDAAVGRQGSRGAVVVTMADTSQLELTINVAEVDISQVEIGRLADITIDALPGQVFRGEVAAIAPAGDAASNLVNYPVTISLIGAATGRAPADAAGATADGRAGLEQVRPGMTAVATLVDTDSRLRDGWLVPSSGLSVQDNATVMTVVRDGVPRVVQVETLAVQGEWTVVRTVSGQEPLRTGDEVVGEVTSRITNNFSFGGGPPGRQGQ